MNLTCEEIILAVKGTLICGGKDESINNISIDTRSLNKGNLYVPLTGENFDGHDFITEAFKKGARIALTKKPIENSEGMVLIKVDDTLKALGDIATYYRGKFKHPFIAITGSVGKTSTKEVIASILGRNYKVLKTQGNYNNEIGVPLTLINLSTEYNVSVIELGMNHLGEISRLTSMVKPKIAVITNIGLSHIGNLGSLENILKAKLEIIEGLQSEGHLLLNGDDELLYSLKNKLKQRVIYYGTRDNLDYQAKNIISKGEEGNSFNINLNGKEYKVNVPLPGMHNVSNVLVGLAVANLIGMEYDDSIERIQEIKPIKNRMNIISFKGYKIIDDVYNASVDSVKGSIDVLKDIGKNRTVAVLGDILEVGKWSEKIHSQIGEYLAYKRIDYIVTYGNASKFIGVGALVNNFSKDKIFHYKNIIELGKFLRGFIKKDDTVLIKASRGMKLEYIVSELTT